MIWKAAERTKVLWRALNCNCKEGELLFKILLGQYGPSNVEVLVMHCIVIAASIFNLGMVILGGGIFPFILVRARRVVLAFTCLDESFSLVLSFE